MTTSMRTAVLGVCFLLLLSAGPTFLMAPDARAGHPGEDIDWVVGDGSWQIGPNWDNTDDAAPAGPSTVGGVGGTGILGSDSGWRTGLLTDPTITIDGGGVLGSTDVLYDAELLGDFRLNSIPGGTGQLVIRGGATLELRSSTSTGGVWTEIDATGITITGPGSKLSRTHTNPSLNGGAFVWGSWRNDPGEVIDIRVLDSAELDNEGQIWFGAYNDSAIDLAVTLEIGEGASVSAEGALIGGISLEDSAGPLEGDINLIYNFDPAANGGLGGLDDSDYTIKMTGLGGCLSVGEFGVVKHENFGPGGIVQTPMSFEDLWDAGILVTTNGNNPNFASNFSVTGQPGDALYMICNIVEIPEPSSFALAALGLLGFGWRRRKR